MNITPEEAQIALNDIRHATTTARNILNTWAYYMLLWGVVWTVGFVVTQLMSQRVNWIWGAMIIIGIAGSTILGIKQSGQVRLTPGSQAAFVNSRLGIFFGTLYGFTILWLIVFPFASLQIGLLWITVVMFGSIIAGAWLQEPVSIRLGVGVTIMSVLGYYLVPHYFWLWAAIFAGLPLIGVSIYYLRQR